MYLERERDRERARVNSSVESQIRQDKKRKSPITQACAGWWHSNSIPAEAAGGAQAASAAGPSCRLPVKSRPPKRHKQVTKSLLPAEDTLPLAEMLGTDVARHLPKEPRMVSCPFQPSFPWGTSLLPLGCRQTQAAQASATRLAPHGSDFQFCTSNSHQPWKPIRKSVKCHRLQGSFLLSAWPGTDHYGL